ncbi:MAG: uracil-DNA glycosylase [Bacilli bacterium]|nr:uracil-DNA glycosylase [Bacilli bacterium]
MKLNDGWLSIIKNDEKLYKKFSKITTYINSNKDIIYPSKENIFKAFNLTDFNNVKVVIIGQDPYHGEGEANGLAFSLNEEVNITPSLRNIFKELKDDLNIDRKSKDLSGWAKQGVLLINSILTVEKDKPMSHKNLGWQEITDYIIKYISDNKSNVVFILWGRESEEKKKFIDENKHYVIISSHPSPFSARKGFFGSKPFSKTNNYLQKNNQSAIDWSL